MLNSEQEEKLKELNEQSVSVVPMLLNRKVTNEDEKELVSTDLLTISVNQKAINNFFEEPIKSAHSTHKWLTDQRKKALDPWVKAKNYLDRCLIDYTIEQNKKLEEAKKKAEKKAPVKAMAMPKKIEQEKGITVVDNWQYAITDESKLPREYLMPNEQLIGKTVKLMKENTKITGIEVFNKGSLRVRS